MFSDRCAFLQRDLIILGVFLTQNHNIMRENLHMFDVKRWILEFISNQNFEVKKLKIFVRVEKHF